MQGSNFCCKHAGTKPGRGPDRRAAGKHCLQPLVYAVARHGGVYISWSTWTTCLLISRSRLAGPRQIPTHPLVAINVNVELSAESTARLPHSSGRGRILLWLSLAFFSFYCRSLSQATTSTIVSSSPFSQLSDLTSSRLFAFVCFPLICRPKDGGCRNHVQHHDGHFYEQ